MKFRIALYVLSFVTTLAKAESAAVDTFARPALLGMQLSAAHGAARGEMGKSQLNCVQALEPIEFYKVVNDVMNAALTSSERASADRFFETPVGKKYAKHGLLQIYLAVGERAPEATPDFSDAEYRELEIFASSSVGQRFIKYQVMQSASAKQAYDNRIRELLAQCKRK